MLPRHPLEPTHPSSETGFDLTWYFQGLVIAMSCHRQVRIHDDVKPSDMLVETPRLRRKAKGKGASPVKVCSSRAKVYHCQSLKTSGGLCKDDLIRSRTTGKLVSKKVSEVQRSRMPGTAFDLWRTAREMVRREHCFGMIACGGKSEAGIRFCALTRETYKTLKSVQVS